MTGVKAYLSTGADRVAAWWPDGQSRPQPLDRMAEAEARRILAETEGGQHTSDCGAFCDYYTPTDGWRYMHGVWTGTPVEGNAHAALIEALSAFVVSAGEDE